MEKPANQQSDNSSAQGSNKTFYLAIIGLLVISNLLTGYLMWDNGQERDNLLADKEQLTRDKQAVEADLTDMLAQYDTLDTENEALRTEIEAQKEHIRELLAEAEKHKNDAYTIYKLRKEAGTLREIMKGYLYTIDSLNTANQNLIAEKQQVEQNLNRQQRANTQLSKQNEDLSGKVRIGARMRTEDFTAFAQRVKSNGTHRETDRANRTDKIKVNITLAANELAKPGQKEIFLRIVAPDGKVLADGQDKEHMFDYEGLRGLYSVRREIKYEGTEQDLSLYWEVKEEIPAGKYIVEAYHDQAKIGSTAFTLK